MSKFVPFNSDVTVPEYFQGLSSPNADFHLMGGAAAMAECVKVIANYGCVTKDFANNNFLAGKFRTELMSCFNRTKKQPKHPKYNEYRKVMPHFQLATNVLVKINLRIGEGYYVQTPVVARKWVEGKKNVNAVVRDFITRSTGFAKEAVTSKIPRKAVPVNVYGLADGFGDTLKYAIKLELGKQINSYTNVEISDMKLSHMMVQKYYDTSLIRGNRLEGVNVDMNTYVSKIPNGSHVVVNNAVHYLTDANLSLLMANTTLSMDGVYMAADMLFDMDVDCSVSALDFELNYSSNSGQIVGNIVGYNVNERAVVTTDFPFSYPIGFLFPDKRMSPYHPYWKGFAIFSKTMGAQLCTPMQGVLGWPLQVVDAGFKATFKKKRPLMEQLTVASYKWLMTTGAYVSPKLNGVAAFAHCDSAGIWRISLRGGMTFVAKIDDGSNRPFVFSTDIQDQFYIEIVAIGDKYFPFYISMLPGLYNRTADKVHYWDYALSNLREKISRVKAHSPALSFKSYYPLDQEMNCVAINGVKNGNVIVKVPMDGVVINDVFMNVGFYHKLVPTYDYFIERVQGELLSTTGEEVVDPLNRYVMPCIYECAKRRGILYIGCPRPDKYRPTDPDHPDAVAVGFNIQYIQKGVAKVSIGRLGIIFDHLNFKDFKRGVITSPFERVLNGIIKVAMDPDKARVITQHIISKLKFTEVLYKDVSRIMYPVDAFVKAASEVAPVISPLYLWANMFHSGTVVAPPTKSTIGRKRGIYVPAIEFWIDGKPPWDLNNFLSQMQDGLFN